MFGLDMPFLRRNRFARLRVAHKQHVWGLIPVRLPDTTLSDTRTLAR